MADIEKTQREAIGVQFMAQLRATYEELPGAADQSGSARLFSRITDFPPQVAAMAFQLLFAGSYPLEREYNKAYIEGSNPSGRARWDAEYSERTRAFRDFLSETGAKLGVNAERSKKLVKQFDFVSRSQTLSTVTDGWRVYSEVYNKVFGPSSA